MGKPTAASSTSLPKWFTLFVWMSSFVITLAHMDEESEDMKLHPENMGIHLHNNEPGTPQQQNKVVEVEVGGFFDFLREMHDEEVEEIQATQQRSLLVSKPSPSPTRHPTGPSRTPTAAPTYKPTVR